MLLTARLTGVGTPAACPSPTTAPLSQSTSSRLPRSRSWRIEEVISAGRPRARQGTPKAGVFAEGAARAVATALIARLRNQEVPLTHKGTGSCYMEFRPILPKR